MRIRDDLLQYQQDMGTSGTLTHNLDYPDVITGITLRFAATNGATRNYDNPIERCISNIEIVDGSDVIMAIPGDVAYAIASQMQGHPPHEYMTGAAGDSGYVAIPLLFGRFLYDPVFGLNPRAFRNPQLKVTFDEATVRAASATAYSTDTFTMTISVHLMEDAPAPEAFLMWKDLYDFTTLGSGDERVDMPVDYPYRMLAIRCYKDGSDMRSGISSMKLAVDGGKYNVFDTYTEQLVDKMARIFRPTFKAGYDVNTSGEKRQTWIGIDLFGIAISHEALRMTGTASPWPGRMAIHQTHQDGTLQTLRPVHWRVDGWCSHNTLLIPFGRLNEVSEWFQAPTFSSVKLFLSQGNASHEANVCVQQVRRY